MADQKQDRRSGPASQSDNPPSPWKQWKCAFIQNLAESAAADRAWDKIDKAGRPGLALDHATALGLALACLHSDHVSKETKKGFDLLASNLKAFRRAEKVARKRARDARTEMFDGRRVAAVRRLAKTPWPFRYSKAKTLSDALSLAPLDVASKKKADALRRWGPRKLMLAALRAGLHGYGVDLSPLEWSALAFCADPDWQVDERALRRFFHEPMLEKAELHFVAIFQSLLNQAESLITAPDLPQVTTTH